ncbi:MAG TPA: YkvA family protein, partial [Pyrinomonadaceae bacterium]|nr:YkvA family protein [Pyrinomonadaceae bacterium]
MTEPQTTKIQKPTRKEKAELKDRMKGFLMFLPNMFKLLGKLLKDSRVPTTEKVLAAGAILYVIMPLDFIPDVIPFIGQVDDAYLVVLTLLRLLNKTDESIVRQHWSGGGDIVALADSIAKLAPMLLPKRVSRVLSSEVELTDAGKSFGLITKNR